MKDHQTFRRGDLVRKRKGSAWQGRVVGEYSTTLTPEGYNVESDAHPGSVQIYPAAALKLIERSPQ
jgi:dihydrofolate reductase (trimethoprim resistance protein)